MTVGDYASHKQLGLRSLYPGVPVLRCEPVPESGTVD